MQPQYSKIFQKKNYHTLQYLHTLVTSNTLWSLFPKEAREAGNTIETILNVNRVLTISQTPNVSFFTTYKNYLLKNGM